MALTIWLSNRNFPCKWWLPCDSVALEKRRELELKCFPQLFLGSLLWTRYSAISCYWPIFSLSLETISEVISEVFAKINSVQSPSRFWSGEFDNTNPVFRTVSVRPMTSYDDIRLKKSNDVHKKNFYKSEQRRLDQRSLCCCTYPFWSRVRTICSRSRNALGHHSAEDVQTSLGPGSTRGECKWMIL